VWKLSACQLEAPGRRFAGWFPSLIAIRGENGCLDGTAYDRQADETWTSFAQVNDAGRRGPANLSSNMGDKSWKLTAVVEWTPARSYTLQQRANLRDSAGEGTENPARRSGAREQNQRFLSVESFRNAGFQCLGVFHAPSAARIGVGHRQRQSKFERPGTILVYDLGGGEHFDAFRLVRG